MHQRRRRVNTKLVSSTECVHHPNYPPLMTPIDAKGWRESNPSVVDNEFNLIAEILQASPTLVDSSASGNIHCSTALQILSLFSAFSAFRVLKSASK